MDEIFKQKLSVSAHGLSENIIEKDGTIWFNDLNAAMEIKGWDFFDAKKIDHFISEYIFPKNKEFSKKDRDGIRQNIPKPQILIQKNGATPANNNPLIGMYLYGKEQLTGDSILNVRSVNKFEQMWIQYFINLKLSRRDNPKKYKNEFFEYSLSGDLNFNYALSGDQSRLAARLRILAISFNAFILLIYVFDKTENEFKHEELIEFVDRIKSSA